MPRSRGSELPQRQSPRLRTASASSDSDHQSDSDHHSPHHHRLSAEIEELRQINHELPPTQTLSDERATQTFSNQSAQIASNVATAPVEGHYASTGHVPPVVHIDQERTKKLSLCLPQVLMLMRTVVALTFSLAIPVIRHKKLGNFHLWKWVLFILAVVSGNLMSEWVVSAAVYCLKRFLTHNTLVMHLVNGLRTPFGFCLWSAFTVVIWTELFAGEVASDTHKMTYLQIVDNSLTCVLAGTILWAIKIVIFKCFTWSFHNAAHSDRKRDFVFTKYVIEMLSRGPRHILWSIDAEDHQTSWNKIELEAKQTASDIFENVANQGSESIFLEDIMRFMPEDMAVKTLRLFGVSSRNGKINKFSLKNWMVDAYRARRSRALKLSDSTAMAYRLRLVMNTLTCILIVAVSLTIYGVITTSFLSFITLPTFVITFTFGNMCEGFVFVLTTDPFDIGDLCEIDGFKMVVEEMHLLTTQFRKNVDGKLVEYPNSVLWTKSVVNLSRDQDYRDVVELPILIPTLREEKIGQLIQRMASYIDENGDLWYPDPLIAVKDIFEVDKLKIVVSLIHRMYHIDMDEVTRRRHLVMEKFLKICEDLNIERCPDSCVSSSTRASIDRDVLY